MIDSRELRIGNAVNVPHGNVIIEKFANDGVHFTDRCGANFKAIEPIPLTPEILKKCGFGRDLDGYHLLLPVTEYDTKWIQIKEIGLIDIIGTEHGIYNLACKYLHQLQNLYFALTGEELEIKNLQTTN